MGFWVWPGSARNCRTAVSQRLSLLAGPSECGHHPNTLCIWALRAIFDNLVSLLIVLSSPFLRSMANPASRAWRRPNQGFAVQWARGCLVSWSIWVGVGILWAGLPLAQAQPSALAPVKIWVGAPAGGTTDTMARAMSQEPPPSPLPEPAPAPWPVPARAALATWASETWGIGSSGSSMRPATNVLESPSLDSDRALEAAVLAEVDAASRTTDNGLYGACEGWSWSRRRFGAARSRLPGIPSNRGARSSPCRGRSTRPGRAGLTGCSSRGRGSSRGSRTSSGSCPGCPGLPPGSGPVGCRSPASKFSRPSPKGLRAPMRSPAGSVGKCPESLRIS